MKWKSKRKEEQQQQQQQASITKCQFFVLPIKQLRIESMQASNETAPKIYISIASLSKSKAQQSTAVINHKTNAILFRV